MPSPATVPSKPLRLWKGAAPVAAKLRAKRPPGSPDDASPRSSGGSTECAECHCDHCGKHLEEDPPKHPQVRAWCHLFDDHISVDADIAEIVLAFWRLDVATVNSCQDNYGTIWVQCDLYDYTDFIERAWKSAQSDSGLMSAYNWFTAAAEQKLSYMEPGGKHEGPLWFDQVTFFINVRVPRGDKHKLQEFLTMAERARSHARCAECRAAAPTVASAT